MNAPATTTQPFAAATKAPASRWLKLDLSRAANAGLVDDVPGDGKGGWTDQGSFKDMRALPVGDITRLGVPFRIVDPKRNNGMSVIVLRGRKTTGARPMRSEPIPVGGRRIERLYFLQSAAFAGHPGTEIGRYVITYEQEKTFDIPLIVSHNTGDWWIRPYAKEISRAVRVKVQGYESTEPYRYLRILEWVNPHPSHLIMTIRFESKNTDATPILLAVTALTTGE